MSIPKFEEAFQRLAFQAEVGGWYKEDSTVPVRIGDLYSTFDRLKELETSSKVNAEDCNEAERILRNIIKEWSISNDVFGAIQQAVEFLK